MSNSSMKYTTGKLSLLSSMKMPILRNWRNSSTNTKVSKKLSKSEAKTKPSTLRMSTMPKSINMQKEESRKKAEVC